MKRARAWSTLRGLLPEPGSGLKAGMRAFQICTSRPFFQYGSLILHLFCKALYLMIQEFYVNFARTPLFFAVLQQGIYRNSPP